MRIPRHASLSRVFDYLARNKEGQIVIAQWPNLPIVGWATFTVLARLVSDDSWKENFNIISTLFLFTWAYMEISQGHSPFRKLIGLAVAVYLVWKVF